MIGWPRSTNINLVSEINNIIISTEKNLKKKLQAFTNKQYKEMHCKNGLARFDVEMDLKQ